MTHLITGDIGKLNNPKTRALIRAMQTKEETIALQEALVEMGKHIEVDGFIGGITINAIKRVNNAEMWEIFEEKTANLPACDTDPFSPYWLETAKKELGVTEIVGKKDNPRVMQYLDAASKGTYAHDETPWCAAFISFVMLKSGLPKPRISVRAKSWIQWGKPCGPVLGAVAIKNRTGGGHVAIVAGQLADGRIVCIGGNQGNQVNYGTYEVSDFTDFRYPKSEEIPEWPAKGILVDSRCGLSEA